MKTLKSNILLVAVMLLIAALVITNIFLFARTPRLAYVRSYELVEGFAGMREARASFDKKKSTLLSNVDSLRANYEQARTEYISMGHKYSPAERVEREKLLSQQQNHVMQYQEVIELRLRDEDASMTEAVLGQINSFVEEYASDKGFDVVMGTTRSGSLLYGSKALDITDELLEKLNKKYKGE